MPSLQHELCERGARHPLDRLTFHAHLLQFTGESARLRQSLKPLESERRGS